MKQVYHQFLEKEKIDIEVLIYQDAPTIYYIFTHHTTYTTHLRGDICYWFSVDTEQPPTLNGLPAAIASLLEVFFGRRNLVPREGRMGWRRFPVSLWERACIDPLPIIMEALL